MNQSHLFNLAPTSFPVLSFVIFTFFFLARKALAVDENFTICSQPRYCGRLNVKFPFFVQESRCGYPGFNVSCRNNAHLILSLPDGDYIIHRIFYQSQSFHVSKAVPYDRDAVCNRSMRNISLQEDRLYLPPNQGEILLLFNCNLTLPFSRPLSQFKVNCDAENETNTTLALFGNDPMLNIALEYCKETVAAPVDFHEGERGVVDILNRGFELNWIASNCSICEASGGKCGFDYKTYHFKCFCPDRPHAWHCRPVEGGEDRNRHRRDCTDTFLCGKLGEIEFPYTQRGHPGSGFFVVDGCKEDKPMVKLEPAGRFYQLEKISQADTITIHGEELEKQLNTNDCQSLKNLSFPNLPCVSFEMIDPTLTLCKCNSALNTSFPKEFSHTVCNNYTIYYYEPKGTPPEQLDNKNYRLSSHCNCPIIRLPLRRPLPFPNLPPSNNPPKKNSQHTNCSFNLSQLLSPNVTVQVRISRQCWKCHLSKGKNKLGLKLGLGIGCPVTLIIIIILSIIFRRRYKQKYASSNFLQASSDPSSKSDLESSSSTVGFGLPIFSYRELVQVTNNFDDEKELGDGGFGTVYYGKLPDGREVAIKRLYQHNYRRLEQFINEVEILTRLRHRNLVSLYGCTSRRSRELLLVYEFIPNGTVADHLHGDRAQFGSLTWSIRMSIAIETASALTYLHASDIIHRDVKTNNILLDDNFSVKVADFGLSRLFPNDVTHISTAPQGTPGYVDPEYHQCYQLTEKSDVYSFGVVLIELISSMPAVDITRHTHDINLANLAINKIQKCAFDELIDPKLGYKSDAEVMRMTTSVAELAFQCVQQEKEMRPSMVEVLEELQRIQSEDCKLENVKEEEEEEEEGHTDTEMPRSVPPPSPQTGDQIALLKNIRLPPSPISVTDKWVSQSTTPNVSG